MRPFLIAAALLLVLIVPRPGLEAQVAERGWNDSYRENIDPEYFGAGRRDALTGRYQAPHRSIHRPWTPRDRRRGDRGYYVLGRGMWGRPFCIWVQVANR